MKDKEIIDLFKIQREINNNNQESGDIQSEINRGFMNMFELQHKGRQIDTWFHVAITVAMGLLVLSIVRLII